MSNNKAIIIGGGIAGPAMALFLKKIGFEAEVFEANEATHSNGVGLNIAPNGLNVLAELGLSDKVILSGSIAKNGIFRNAKGSQLAKFRFSNSEKYKYPSVNLKRETLNNIMLDELENKSISIHYNKKIQKISQTEQGVIAYFEDGSQSLGTFLIGADGVRSKTREFVLDHIIEPTYTGIVGSGGFIDKKSVPNLLKSDSDDVHFVYGKNGFFGFSGVNENELMWWTNIMVETPYSREELKNFDQKAEKNNLLNQYRNYSFPVSEIIQNTKKFVRQNVFDVPFLPNYFKQNIILIGDSAHAVSPNSGQGASMALEDAMLLAKVIRDNETLETAFETFEKVRRSRVEKIVLEGRKRGNDKLIVSSFQQKIREFMIRIFVGAFAEKGNHWLFDYKINWDEKN